MAYIPSILYANKPYKPKFSAEKGGHVCPILRQPHDPQETPVHGLGMTLTLKPTGSTTAFAQIENGKQAYRHAYPFHR